MRSKRLPLGLKNTKHNKRVKQLLIIGLSLFVIFSQLSMSPLSSALADSSSTAPNTDNQFLDSVKLTTGDPSNSTDVSTDNPLKKGEPVNLEYAWTQKNGQTLSADKDVTVQIPTNFNFDKDATGNVTLSDNKTVIGTYTVKASSSTTNANQLTVHFNDQAAGLTNAGGKIVIPATFNTDPNSGPNPVSIVFDLGNSKTQIISVPVDQSAPGTNSSVTPSVSSSSASSSGPTPSAGTASPSVSSGVSSGISVKTKSFVKSLAVAAPQEITQNILTGVTLTDANGNPYDASNKATTSSPANISFTYTIPNGLKVNDGDFYTFKLPNDFAIYNTINGNLDDGSGNQIGTFTVTTDGMVTMTFINNASNGNYFDNHSNVDGSLEVHTQFNSQTITGTTQQQITFPINSPVTLTIPFKPSKTMDSIDKQGTPDKSINPGNINWTVNINEAENTLTNAKVTDPTLTGLSLNTSSIQVYPLTVNVDGSTTLGTTPVPASDYTVQDSDGNLEIDFNNPISSAYQIQYSTAITDAGKNISSFDNKATLTSDGVSSVTADATVTNKRGDHLTKTATGYNASTQTITWTINYNGDDKSIPDGTVLHDLFDNTQDLVNNSVKVYQATVNNDGSFSQGTAVSSGYSVTPTFQTGKNGFDLTFNGNGNSGAYQIVYQTIANGLVTANGTVNNSVTENSGTPVNVSQGIAQQGIQKYSTGSNFANKTDTWHITVNGNHYQLNNAKIIDTFDNAGLSLQNATFKIHDDTTNNDLTEGTDYTLNTDSNGFTVVFQGAYTSTSDAFTIDYTTDFNFANLTPGKTNFSNTSVLSWTDAGGKSQSSTSTATFTPDSNTQSNGFKNGSYDATTKQITWNVGVNYNLATITDPVISDPITGDQQYVDGSFELHYMTLTGGANGVTVGAEVPTSDYTVDYPSSSNSNTLTVHFLSPITTPYYITYKTSLGGQIVNASYTNTATVKDGSSTVTTLNASVNPAHGGSFASKNGTQDGNYVDWTVNINSSQSTVSNAELDDTPTNNQIIDPNSFHLYPQTVDTSGNLTTDTGNELQQGKDYTLTINTDNNTGAQTFTIKFVNPIDSAYQLTYSTLINANNGDTLGNTANFSGNNIQTVTQQTSQNVTVHISSGSGTGSGVNGSLTIFKDDAVSHAALPGATFTLYDSTGTTPLRTLTTGTNGEVAFNNFKYGTYILKEIQAPVGYTISNALVNGTPVTIDATSSAAGALTTIDDNQNKVILTKQDVNGNGLTGATFSLLKDGQPYPIGHAIQSVAGQVEIDGLVPGSYELTETVAPTGYLINSTPINFTVTENANNQIPDVNLGTLTDYQGSATLTKDDNANHPLAGAVYELQMQSGDGSWNTIETNLVTGSDGTVSASGLAPGTYQFVETQAPAGYTVNGSPVGFTIASTSSGDPGTQQLSQSDSQDSVVLTKVDANDSNAKLSGAEFQLEDSSGNVVAKDAYGNSLKSVWTTDSSGQFTINGLAPGSYQFVETAAPSGYQLDSTPVPFTVSNKDTKAVSITASDKPSAVTLTKTDASDSNAELSGAEFQLEDSNGQAVTADATGKTLPATWTTDSSGQFTVNGLAPGSYQFIETKAPNGYQLDQTPIPFKITNTDVQAVPITATDKLNSVTLTKVDANDSNAKLPGAEFELQDSKGNVVTTDVTGKALPTIWTTDSNGQFTVNGLSAGNYQFVETKAPNGYQLDQTPTPFTVTNTDVQAVPITATNKLNAVTLTKVDVNDKNAVLQGAEFKLYDNNNNVVQKDVNGKALPSIWTTNSKGQFTVNGLVPGNYHFIETKAPLNYNLDTTPIPFQVTNADIKAILVTATDKLTPGDVQLTKVDSNDKNAVLKGAVFKLEDSSGKTLETGLTTNDSGQFIVRGLAPGKYFFVETKAPNGYQLDATPIPFTIAKGQAKAVEITATDKPLVITKQLTGKPGATYNVVDQNGHVLVRGVMADSEGHVHFKGLASGKYHLVLVRGVKGEAQTNSVKKTRNSGLPTTGDTNDIFAMMTGTVLLLGGGAVAFFTRRRRKN
ncbi:SpaA isopeptide-forming pilin-related protein [Sporolactobacillus pectinivorans]|uniref:SpaA isopeptide-forming pilin-related protein n=1 Tax=Sporolactobacillus pectinivorans TaxID=1591408 RepID=UPI000C264623|nr:SpaA isopeptide-forming pilin-related protein [Sporolactobacillus pectinivorans]